MAKLTTRQARHRRKKHIRKIVHGTPERPRLCVFRSANHIYAQIIDDENHKTLASASTRQNAIASSLPSTGNVEAAKAVGKAIAEAAREKQVSKVVFNRNGFLYHGRVKALAEAARDGGLVF